MGLDLGVETELCLRICLELELELDLELGPLELGPGPGM